MIIGNFKSFDFTRRKFKKDLKKDKLTTRDSRVVERKRRSPKLGVSNFQKINHLNLKTLIKWDKLLKTQNSINVLLVQHYVGMDVYFVKTSKHKILNLCAQKYRNIFLDKRIKKNSQNIKINLLNGKVDLLFYQYLP